MTPVIAGAVSLGLAIGILIACAGLPLGWYHKPGPAPTMLAASAPGPDVFGTGFTTAPPPDPATIDRLRRLVPQNITRGAVDGTARGLYGGSLDNASCNGGAILSFLQQNPAKAAAWSGALSIQLSELESYITSLTAVTLLDDTWVTNHGFRAGVANAFQSVLQAGTAVLVDQRGVPRVRCECGNPLTEAAPSAADPAGAETPWAGYDDSAVVRVGPGSPLDTVSMVDLAGAGVVQRGIGLGRAGQVQVSLIWSTDADLDVHVVDPTGYETFYSQQVAPSGGRLDLDTIPQRGFAAQHIENIYWDEGAPAGNYTAFIRNFNAYDSLGSPYQMEVYAGGVLVRTVQGSLVDGQDGQSVTFGVRG